MGLKPADILERARALDAEGYDEIPLHLLLGAAWTHDPGALEPLRPLLKDYLIRWTETPGFLEIVDADTVERRRIPRDG